MNFHKIKKYNWVCYSLLFIFLAVAPIQPLTAQKNRSEKVTIKVERQPLESVFSEISKQTGLKFFYGETVAGNKHNVTLDLKDASVETILSEINKQTNLYFNRENNTISVTDRKQEVKSTSAITRSINGIVTDEQGEPIIGANILERGTTNGTITDLDGAFNLNVSESSSLVISYIGYMEKVVPVGNTTVFNIKLSEDAKALDEVVVVGYGVQKKVNLTGSISTLDAAALENRPITNSTQALQGVQGVYVNQPGGQPGADNATIRIRGMGTLNNNDPLVLVDGVEFPLEAINPNDIESISILKDAASSAIYGARAANGVVLVKTKAGKKGAFTVEYNNYFGVQKPTYLPDFVYDPIVFMEMRNQAQINEGKLVVDYSPELIEEYRQGMKTNPTVYPQNNWLDIMYNDAFIMEHNLRFSGGDDKYTYSVSLGYGDQDGVLRGTDSKKYTLAINTTAQINSRLRIGANVNAHYKNYNEPAAGVPNLVEMTYKAQAFHPTYLDDGRYADTFIRTPGHNIYRHPLALADEGESERNSLRLLGNFSAEYKLPFNINYNLNVGLSKYDYLHSLFAPDIYEYQVKTENKVRVVYDGVNTRRVKKTDQNNLNKTFYNTLSWGENFNNTHDVKLLVGYSYEDTKESEFFAQREGFLGNELHELDAGSNNPSVGGASEKSVLMSYFGRANYNYKERYLLEANFRYDGSSRFAKGNRWGLFPSFSAGWRLSEESFMKNISWLNNLKLRVSWGQLGNERIDLFRYVDLMTLGKNYPFNGNISSGAAVTAYNDPNITWETTTMTNIAIDAALFNSSLDFTFEVFKKRTSDILRAVSLPHQVGSLDGPIRNIGTVDNTGFELGLSYRNKINDFNYRVYGNVTYVKNEIVDLKGQTIIDDIFILKEGHPIDSYYMLHAEGIFQSEEEIKNSPTQTAATKPGYLKFADTNGDKKITEDDRQIRGSIIPKFTYTFGLDLSYKNFDLTAFFQGVADVYTYGDRIGATPLWFGCGLPKAWVTDAWTPERGTSAKLPILTTYEGSLNENFRKNDFWLRDASYLRLKNLQISYTVPNKVLKSTFIKSLKVFANAQNLFTISPMKDFDPEKDMKKTTWYEYPSLKTFSGGINVTF